MHPAARRGVATCSAGALCAALLVDCGSDGGRGASPVEPPGRSALAGRIAGADTGAPVSGADVLVEGASLESEGIVARSAEDGSFAFDLPPGSYRVTACKTDFSCASESVSVATGARVTLDLRLPALPRGGSPQPPGSIAGAVRLRDGTAAPEGSVVELHRGVAGCEEAPAVAATVDREGRFESRGLTPGVYVACARATVGGRTFAGRRGVLVDPGGTSLAVLTLDAATAPLVPPSQQTVALADTFELIFTIVGDGTGASLDVVVSDTLPILDDPAGPPGPGDRDGGQAFRYVTDRPTFDPDAIRYVVDVGDDEGGTAADDCFEAPVSAPAAFDTAAALALCDGTIIRFPTLGEARAAAEAASAGGDQIVVVQYFDADILDRVPPEGDVEAEDAFGITLAAIHSVNEFRGDDGSIPERDDENGDWCNLISATSAANDYVTRIECTRVVAPRLEVRKTAEDAVVPAGGQVRFRLEVGNLGSADLLDATLGDTLDPAFLSPADGDPGLVRVESLCAGCAVSFSADSSGLILTIPQVPPTDADGDGSFDDDEGFLAADLVVRTPLAAGQFCNRVTAVAGGLHDADLSCVVTDLRFELDVTNDDGRIEGGAFTDVETFQAGDTVAYRTSVINRSATPVTGLSVRWELAPETGIVQLDRVLAADPEQVTCDTGADACSLSLDVLPPEGSVSLDYLALAAFPGNDVNRITVDAPGLVRPIVNEEPTTVEP